MSHFTVLVIGKNPEDQLAPYQEKDGDNIPIEWCGFNETETESRKEYENDSVEQVIMDNGEMVCTWDHRFKRRKFPCAGSIIPEHLTRIQVLFTEMFETFELYMSKWCGQDSRDSVNGVYGYWANPNSKWDWHSLGGRWTGHFKLVAGGTGVTGKPGLLTEKPEDGYVDQALKSDIDFEGMHTLGKDCTTFAVVRYGQWFERGSMGWWGIVTDEKRPSEWNVEFDKLIGEIPDDELLSVYDCHI